MQIDLEPEKYRKQHRETGRWVQNIDKPMCRWMALIGVAFLVVMGSTQTPSLQAMALFAMVGAAVGALWVLSLRSTDW